MTAPPSPALIRGLAARMRGTNGSPIDAFAALEQALRPFPGHRIFTVLSIDQANDEVRRVYTNEPDSYPCGYGKPLRRDSVFFQQVVVECKPRVCHDREACRLAFPDFALIDALGCASAINVPICIAGRTAGALNLLHSERWYRQGMATYLAPFAELAGAALIRHMSDADST